MVTREQMVEMSRRHDTQVAEAFRRALGVAGPKHRRNRRRKRVPRYCGLLECFENRRSPMDRGRM